jgi:hypothetical protein
MKRLVLVAMLITVLCGCHQVEYYKEKYLQSPIFDITMDGESRVEVRQDYAWFVQNGLIKQGYDDLRVKAIDEDCKTLEFTWSQMTQSFADDKMQQTHFSIECVRHGFKKVVFTDGKDKTWSYEL